jgi:endonuclease/exonuclease/phosphatase family metal-dependent hydrolase
MRRPLLFGFLVVACSSSELVPLPSAAGRDDAAVPGPDARAPRAREAGALAGNSVRIMAANTTSGAASTYDPEESLRLFQGLHPDIALLQELKVGDGSEEDLKAFVTRAFGEGFHVFRESGGGIPNGIVSRYPLLESGQWDDPEVSDRSFAWAKIDVPGGHPLWAVSVHLLTSSDVKRASEANALVAKLEEVVASGDHVLIGGDFNTPARTEECLTVLGRFVSTAAPYPADGSGDADTNRPRSKPYDWVLVDPELAKTRVPTVIGESSFPNGLVFDSRVYQPLSEVAPIQKTDSDAVNMQHMPVVRDFTF